MNHLLHAIDQFLDEPCDSREYKRAVAVKMALTGYMYEAIRDVLHIPLSSISEWKHAYLKDGIDAFRLKYKGSTGFLSPHERTCVLHWIQAQDVLTVDRVRTYIDETYHITFQSRQSYYDLLAEANVTCKKVQRTHPKADPAAIDAKKKK